MVNFEIFGMIITSIILGIGLAYAFYLIITCTIGIINCNKELKRLDIELERSLKELSNCFNIGEKNKHKINNDIIIIENKYIKDKELFIVYRYENDEPGILYTRNVFSFLSEFETYYEDYEDANKVIDNINNLKN